MPGRAAPKLTLADICAARAHLYRVSALVTAEAKRRGEHGVEGGHRRVARDMGYDLDALMLAADGQERVGDVVRYVGP
jgi:hypothetical protein